jgi:CopG family nickel-responsive transcriptional regulator
MEKKLERFGVSVNADLLRAFDRVTARQGYRTRSEALRDLMRDHLVAQEWQGQRRPVVGTVTIVYNHETRELNRVLTQLQHQFHTAIVCSSHVHLDEHNCLEVIVVKGRADEVRAIADQLISTKGVKHGKLVCTTTGEQLP